MTTTRTRAAGVLIARCAVLLAMTVLLAACSTSANDSGGMDAGSGSSFDSDPGGSAGDTGAGVVEAPSGTSRKYALPILEWFDQRGITRREGDLRFPRS